MNYKAMADLIWDFLDKNNPHDMLYGHPTIDEQIEQSPYDMLRTLALFLEEKASDEAKDKSSR